MKLLAISKFLWKDHIHQPGEYFEADEVKGAMFIAQGYAKQDEQAIPSSEPAANQSEQAAAESNAGDIGKPSAVSKSKKKAKR